MQRTLTIEAFQNYLYNPDPEITHVQLTGPPNQLIAIRIDQASLPPQLQLEVKVELEIGHTKLEDFTIVGGEVVECSGSRYIKSITVTEGLRRLVIERSSIEKITGNYYHVFLNRCPKFSGFGPETNISHLEIGLNQLPLVQGLRKLPNAVTIDTTRAREVHPKLFHFDHLASEYCSLRMTIDTYVNEEVPTLLAYVNLMLGPLEDALKDYDLLCKAPELFQAHFKAERPRIEDCLENMLGELHKKLQQLARLKIEQSITQRAKNH